MQLDSDYCVLIKSVPSPKTAKFIFAQYVRGSILYIANLIYYLYQMWASNQEILQN